MTLIYVGTVYLGTHARASAHTHTRMFYPIIFYKTDDRLGPDMIAWMHVYR
jgi:hypothetical protein